MMAAGNYRRDVAILDCPEWEDLVWMWSCGLSLLSASLQRFIIYPTGPGSVGQCPRSGLNINIMIHKARNKAQVGKGG